MSTREDEVWAALIAKAEAKGRKWRQWHDRLYPVTAIPDSAPQSGGEHRLSAIDYGVGRYGRFR